MSATLLLLRRDLRLHDHPGFLAAVSAPSLTVLYVVDDRLFAADAYGTQRASHHRLRFLHESLQDLAHTLEALGQTLHVAYGNPAAVATSYLQQGWYNRCITQWLPGTEETDDFEALSAVCKQSHIQFNCYASACMLDPDGVESLFTVFPAVFRDFRRKTERYLKPAEPVAAPPSLPPPEHRARPDQPGIAQLRNAYNPQLTARFTGGETPGVKRLRGYIWDENRLATYKETRNGMLGDDYSSKLSPWLAWGCLSPRLVASEIKQYEEERVANESTYWLYFELLWREFFYYTAAHHNELLYMPGGMRRKPVPARRDDTILQAWRAGNTGIPIIDACMRELLATGYMSNRGRQLVASFLVKDLRQPWLAGAAWFEHCLLDYDAASNYGNWQYVAGVGNDPREDRYFNILSQAERYDADGAFVRHWIPALQSISAGSLHKPHQWKHTPEGYVQPVFHAAVWERR